MLKGIVSGAEKAITRIPMQVGGSYKEGWEVRDNQDRIIWGREDELQTVTGTLPFKGYGLPAKVKSLLGNGQQTGTPTPDNPVMPTFCGVRTVNICPSAAAETKTNNGITAVSNGSGTYHVSGKATADADIRFDIQSFLIPKSIGSGGSGTYSMFNSATYENADVKIAFYYQGTKVDDWGMTVRNRTNKSYEKMGGKDCDAIGFTVKSGVTVDFTLSPEFTYDGVLPSGFEPFGYKIPITCAGQTTPVYLGQTPTVRKVKKYEFTGNEDFNIDEHLRFSIFISDIKPISGARKGRSYCSHYECLYHGEPFDINWNNVHYQSGSTLYFHDKRFTTVNDFKSYLAAQYAAGTPVTVWYILAEPTTGIINEPLAKIGDYADELNDAIATLPEIPTATGQNTLTVDATIAPSSLTVKGHAKKIHYGFKIDKSNYDSEDAVTYTHDAVTMTPAHMDFANDRFDYGSWENSFFVRDCYPVALNLDGTEAYKLDPDDYTKKSDGTPSDIFYELLTDEPSDWSTQWKQYYTKSGDEYVLNSQDSAPTFATDTYYKLTYNPSFTGNFMMAFPKVWFYRHEDSKYNCIEISNHKLSDDWKCYAHINANGQEVKFIYLPLFKGVIVNSKLRSLPGQIPQGNTTATTEVNAATALGSRWQIWDHSSAELINDLLTLMSKSIDSQGRFGQGRSMGYDSTDTVTYGKLQTGTLIKKGKFHGYSATTKEVKVFGIESFWANRLDRLQGMLLVDNVWKIKMTPPYNFTGTDFVTLSNAEVPSGNGYLSELQTSEYGSIPASISNGSSTKYFKDYFNKEATGARVALRGGNCGRGVRAGFRYVNVGGAASGSAWHIGASPVYK